MQEERIANARVNRTKARLAAGHTTFGITLRFPSDQVVEIAASCGCDFVLFDIEHEGFSMAELVSMTRVADLAGITPIARVGAGMSGWSIRCLPPASKDFRWRASPARPIFQRSPITSITTRKENEPHIRLAEAVILASEWMSMPGARK